MTYPTNKKQEAIGKRQNRQDGVTLLLAILVLSSIMAISFSLATILFIEVRTSGDLLRTEPAYYGASGVGEEATFNIKRNACTGTCTYTSNFGNNVTADTPVQTLVSTPIFQDKISPNTDPAVNFASGKSYNIYDATAGISSTGGSNYGKIVLNYVDNGQTGQPLQVYLCQYDPSGNTIYATPVCSSPDTNATPSYWPFANAAGAYIDANTPLANRTWTLDPNMQQELILFNPNRNGNIYVSVETFDASGVPKGLPYSGETAVSIQTNNSAVGRRLLVVVPNTVGASSGSVTTSQTVSEGGTASLTCSSGTISSYTSTYGKGSGGGGGSCPVACGACTIGSASCSVTYNNSNCGDCNPGYGKNGDLSITCTGGSSGGSSPLYLINNGGGGLTDTEGTWTADNSCSYGGNYYNAYQIGNAIANASASDQAIYQTQCWFGGIMSYSFSVPNGSHTVKLKFSENYFGTGGGGGGDGSRQFNIVINGTTVASNFDIYSAAGHASFTAVDVSFPVNVVGGNITIQLTPGAANNPTIDGIDIN